MTSPSDSVADTMRVAAALKIAFSERLAEYLKLTGNTSTQIDNRVRKLHEVHQDATKYFNVYEKFVGESHLAGAYGSSEWLRGFAEDCSAVLDSIPRHHFFLKKQCEANNLNYDLLFRPSTNAFAAMQRLVKRTLPEDAESLALTFAKFDLPVKGFDSPSEPPSTLPDGFSPLNISNISGTVSIVNGHSNTTTISPASHAKNSSEQAPRSTATIIASITAVSGAVVAILVLLFGDGVCSKDLSIGAVSIGQSGGQNAQVIVNNRPLSRTIPVEIAARVEQILAAAPECISIASTQGDTEAFNYRGLLIDLFRRSGWEVKDARTFMFFDERVGLFLNVFDRGEMTLPDSLSRALPLLTTSEIGWNNGIATKECPYFLQVWHSEESNNPPT